MKTVIGILMMLAGIVIGLYLGVWVMFVGGIVDIVDFFFNVRPLDAILLAFGILKVFFASIVGWLSFMFLAIPGWAIVSK